MTEEEAAENGLTFESLQLLRDNIGVEQGLTFAIREGGRTVGSGRVATIIE